MQSWSHQTSGLVSVKSSLAAQGLRDTPSQSLKSVSNQQWEVKRYYKWLLESRRNRSQQSGLPRSPNWRPMNSWTFSGCIITLLVFQDFAIHWDITEHSQEYHIIFNFQVCKAISLTNCSTLTPNLPKLLLFTMEMFPVATSPHL